MGYTICDRVPDVETRISIPNSLLGDSLRPDHLDDGAVSI